MAVARNDDVILHQNSELFARCDDLFGHIYVSERRRGIARWMIMHQDDGGRRKFQRALYHFAGIDWRVSHRALLLHFISDQLIFLSMKSRRKLSTSS